MTDSPRHLNRRSFLKRFGATVGVLTTTSVVAPRIPAFADGASSDVSATAQDSDIAARYTVLQWNGPTDAVVQIRKLQMLGSWTAWQDAPHWADAQQSPDSIVCQSGLIRTGGAQALQARALTPGVTNLGLVRISGSTNATAAN